MKITIIGGGSSIFVPLILRRIMVEKSLEGCTVSLMDIDSHRVQTM
jgi:alpha-galactosidase/6-phospho-beta-glucosidase family protein